jgi:hypothetical protein
VKGWCQAVGLSLTLVCGAAAQTTLPSRIVLATVAAGNRSLVDLDVDDFVVDEGGAARDVFDVHVADYPLVVLVDNATDRTEQARDIRDAAARFVSRIGQRGVAVGTLTSPNLLVEFEEDRAEVLARIREIEANPTAPLVPLEAIATAIRLIQKTETPFSTVVVVSGRAIDPGETSSPALLAPVLDARFPVHVIAHRASEPGAGSADLLREVASLTKGQYTPIYTSASYAIALDRLADRMSTEMMIQFVVPPGSKGGEIRVGVKIPGARVVGLGVSK